MTWQALFDRARGIETTEDEIWELVKCRRREGRL